MPPPLPPSVKLGRITIGKPPVALLLALALLPTSAPISALMRLCTAQASSSECAMPLRAEPRPIEVIASLNFSRSSAFSIACSLAPIISTPYLASTPCRCRSSAQFSAVWPPIVGNTAILSSGRAWRSLAMIFSTTCQVMGSM